MEFVPTPLHPSIQAPIAPPPGLDLPETDSRTYSSSMPIDVYRMKNDSSNHAKENDVADEPKVTLISLVAATASRSHPRHSGRHAPIEQCSSPLASYRNNSKKGRTSNNSRLISLMDATAGTPISLANATAHLPRASEYSASIADNGACMGLLPVSSMVGGMFAGSTIPQFHAPFGTASAQFHSVFTPTATASTTIPDIHGNGHRASGDVLLESLIYGDVEVDKHQTVHEYYATVDSGDRSTTSDEEDDSGLSPLTSSSSPSETSDNTALQAYYQLSQAWHEVESAYPPDYDASWEGGVTYDGRSLEPLTDAPYTLVWISELAFKQRGSNTRESLEAFGVPIKAHKSSQKAIRSLGKREAKAMRFDSAVVIVSPKEAREFMRFLTSTVCPQGGVEIRPCWVIVGPGNIDAVLQNFLLLVDIPACTNVRCCSTWDEINSLLGSILEPPLQSV
eukprot:GEMP01016433.1.p1 GENE.GEMP01016433.1~~GEMP01016433.1.p1  ORF type:complete len:451 (-),score=96.33 GEMP01016433.1:1229-2581(-)